MQNIERDPKYISETVKFFRKNYNLTQENLAEEANLTTRTIEKIESGRHRPNEQTLRSIARALKLEISIFKKPTPEEERRFRMEIERTIKKKVMVPTTPIHNTRDFLSFFQQHHGFRFDDSAVEREEAMEVSASMVDWIKDLNDIWDEVNQSDRLTYSHEFAELCNEIENHGYICHMGSHRQMLREKGKQNLIINVGLMVILPKDFAENKHFAIVHLEGNWETLEQDRMELPKDWLNSQDG